MIYNPLTAREVLGKFSEDCKYESQKDFYNEASDKEIYISNELESAEYEADLSDSINFVGGLMLFLDQMSYTDPCHTEFEGMTVKELFEILENIPEHREKYENFKIHLKLKQKIKKVDQSPDNFLSDMLRAYTGK